MSEKEILKKIDDIWNYCEEIDNHLPKEEQTGYRMLPDIFYIQKGVRNLQQKVEQLEKENEATLKNYGNLVKEWKQLENIRKEAIEATKDVKQFVYDELVDRNVSGATETHCKIMDLLNILNKGSDEK